MDTNRSSDLLRKLQIDHPRRRRALEQIPVIRRLLHHPRVQCIPLRPSLLVIAVALQHACEEGLCGWIFGVIGRTGEFVEGEGEGDEGQGDVEAALEYGSVSDSIVDKNTALLGVG